MYCSKCGNKMVDGDKFCTACGQKADSIPTKADYSAYSRPKTQTADLPRREKGGDFSAPLIGGGLAELYAEELPDTPETESAETLEIPKDTEESQTKTENARSAEKKRTAKRILCVAAALIFAAGCSAATYRYAWAAGAESMTITSGELDRANDNATEVRNFVQTYIGANVNDGRKKADVQQEILGEYDCAEYSSSDFGIGLRKKLQEEGINSGTVIISTAYIGGMDTLFVQWREDGDKNDVKAVGQSPDPISFESRYAVIFGQYMESET